MAIYALVKPGVDIINGASVCQPVGSGYILDNPQRDLHFKSLTSMTLGTELDSRYHVGASGGWERPWGPIQ